MKKMSDTLKDLYLGDPFDDDFPTCGNKKIIYNRIESTKALLRKELTENQEALLVRLEELHEDYTSISEYEHYVHGFRIGARLMFSIFDDEISDIGVERDRMIDNCLKSVFAKTFESEKKKAENTANSSPEIKTSEKE